MAKVRVAGFSISLDGFGAGPEQSLENPLGKRGRELHEWMFGTRMFQAMIGKDGGSDGVDEAYAHRSMDGFGAFILGRNMFGPIRGPWPDESWKGWWGVNPPYHAPTFVLTHHAVALYFFLATRVAVARGKFDVKLPATTGNTDFERIFRVHMNTLEWMPTFLVPLWLCAIYLNDIAAALLGLVWIGGRVIYFVGYRKAVEKRLPGFFIQSTVCLLLFIGAIVGIVMHWSVG